MPITDNKAWESWVSLNTDPYGKACIDVARRVMELLDENIASLVPGYYPDMNTAHGLICKADKDVNAGGITGFMASAVAEMVSKCHSRGDEFRKSYNGDVETEGVVNHAVLSIRPQ